MKHARHYLDSSSHISGGEGLGGGGGETTDGADSSLELFQIRGKKSTPHDEHSESRMLAVDMFPQLLFGKVESISRSMGLVTIRLGTTVSRIRTNDDSYDVLCASKIFNSYRTNSSSTFSALPPCVRTSMLEVSQLRCI